MRSTLILTAVLLLSGLSIAYSQESAGVKILPKQGALYENTKNLNNPYVIPLWGEKLGRKGFLLPYPIGISVNGYAAAQDVTVSDLSIGINDGQLQSLDNIVGFSKVTANVQDINVRTDLWILPFLDVYGIYGKTWVQTDVGIGSIVDKPVDLNTQANFDGYVYGIGAMLTGGIRSVFFSLDMSKIWTHLGELKGDNSAVNFGLRTGYVFHFQGNPEKNISVWTGATRLYLSGGTDGTINLSEVMPDIGNNYQNSDWYEALGPVKQKLVDELVEKAENVDSQLHYTLKKRPAKDWSMILGAQYQIDRNWQFRAEANFLGGRKSGLISASYRFGINTNKGK